MLSSVAASGVGLLLAAAGAHTGWWLLVSLIAVAPLLVVAVEGRAKILFARRRRKLIGPALAAYAPDFVVYTAGPDNGAHQVMMWMPYLKRSGLRCVIVCQYPVLAARLAELADVPVIEARSIADLDSLVVPSLKAAFYVNASSGNGTLVRFQHLTHVFLGHGDSDKPTSYNPTHAMYDQIFAAGPAATRRYAAHGVRIPAEKFRIVGRPQVEAVLPATRPIADITQPTVLYAPTWRGHVEETLLYSLPRGEEIIDALLARGARIIFRPHPFSYGFPEDAAVITRIQTRLHKDAQTTGRQHLWGAAAEKDLGILDCINASDAMVSDVSSVVSDYLFSGKPFAMIAVPSEPATFVEQFPVARASYVVHGDLTDLNPQLDLLLGPDPLATQRTATRVDYLGDFPAQGYADAFIDAVRTVSTKTTEDFEDEDDGEWSGESSADAASTTLVSPAAVSPAAVSPRSPAAVSTATASGAGPGGRRDWSRYTQLAVGVGLDLAGTALALGSFAVALASGPVWLVAGLALLAVLSTVASEPDRVRQPSRWHQLLSHGDATRAVLAFALIVAAHRVGDPDWPYLAAAAALLIGAAVERRIRSAWEEGLLARNLPRALAETTELIPRGVLPLLAELTAILALIVLGLNLPPILVAVLGAAVLLVVAEVTLRSIRRAAQAGKAEPQLRTELETYAPQFVVYFASTVGAAYQVGMWLDYFVRIGRPFIVITRTSTMLLEIAQLCEQRGLSIPLVYRRTLRSVEEAIVDTMTTAFYVNNAPRNTHLIERRELTHIWLNHGDSEKPACYNPVHAIYDLIFTAGQAGIDRYARHGVSIPREKFIIIGRPQVELITPARAPIHTIDTPTVLYAPTWQGPFADTRVYSLPQGRAIIEQLLTRGVRIIFRAHPFNYRYRQARDLITDIGTLLATDRTTTGRDHRWGPAAEKDLTIEDCFNASDAMISDVSAVVSDYLRSDKPFAMVSIGREPETLEHEAPAARAAYVLREDLTNLPDVLDNLLTTDPLATTRQQTKIYYLGDFPDDGYAEGFLRAARSVIDREAIAV